MNPNKFFSMLKAWKKLPAYRMEPRIDAMVAYYFPELFRDALKIEVSAVIPELPLRLGTIYPTCKNQPNRSFKVDFFVLGKDGQNFLVEMKSDSGSISVKQCDYLKKTREIGMKALIGGICQITAVSSFTKKYKELKSNLKRIGLINDNFEYIGKRDDVTILFIQPGVKNPCGDSSIKVIDFQKVATVIEKYYQDDFSLELAESLREWSD